MNTLKRIWYFWFPENTPEELEQFRDAINNLSWWQAIDFGIVFGFLFPFFFLFSFAKFVHTTWWKWYCERRRV